MKKGKECHSMQGIITKIRDYFWSKQGIICKKANKPKFTQVWKQIKKQKNDTLAPESLE